MVYWNGNSILNSMNMQCLKCSDYSWRVELLLEMCDLRGSPATTQRNDLRRLSLGLLAQRLEKRYHLHVIITHCCAACCASATNIRLLLQLKLDSSARFKCKWHPVHPISSFAWLDKITWWHSLFSNRFIIV